MIADILGLAATIAVFGFLFLVAVCAIQHRS